LKNNKKNKSEYKALEWKIYIRIALITVIALIIVTLLYLFVSAGNNITGNFIVSAMQRLFNMSYNNAYSVYWTYIRGNFDYFIFAAVVVFFIILSRFLLSQFAKYFNEISNNLDKLVKDDDTEISMSKEMYSMELKIKTIQHSLKEREREAKLAEQRKKEIVAYLAHDIKTPLTSVIGYLSLLDEAPDMPEEQKKKYIQIGLDKAYRLESLINEFFEITRYNMETITLYKKDIDLYYMLVQLTDEVYPQIATHGKKANVNIPADLNIQGDPDKLARAFNNILKNAIYYGDENSDIDITAEKNSSTVSINFKNAGNIPNDKLNTIFDKFYRLSEARSSDTGGAGLGLAIAKEIITLHDGTIRAESENGFTTFIVELPAVNIKKI